MMFKVKLRNMLFKIRDHGYNKDYWEYLKKVKKLFSKDNREKYKYNKSVRSHCNA